jgi:hypothetical protein
MAIECAVKLSRAFSHVTMGLISNVSETISATLYVSINSILTRLIAWDDSIENSV